MCSGIRLSIKSASACGAQRVGIMVWRLTILTAVSLMRHAHTRTPSGRKGGTEEDNATQSESPVAYMYMVLNIHAFERAAFVCWL